uniref:Uncharacterized protein n=1 Tax=Arundo donax TaxID=35708 RepID=A0A0A9D5J3_ARUDO
MLPLYSGISRTFTQDRLDNSKSNSRSSSITLTIAVSDERVEEEHRDPRCDDEGGREAVQPPLHPVSGGLRARALLLRRRRRRPPPKKGSPRPLHSFAPLPLTSAPRNRTRPRQGPRNPAGPNPRRKERSEPRGPARGGAGWGSGLRGRGRVASVGWGVLKRSELHQGKV